MGKRELLTNGEVILLDKMLLAGIHNGNSANAEPFIPTHDEYVMMYEIRKKLLAD